MTGPTVTFAAVIFDWRGTLVTTLSERQWVHEALAGLGRGTDPADVDRLLTAIRAASGVEDRLEGPGVDSDAEYHRRTYLEVFHDAGCDDDLARALYEVESDARHNPFATDALDTVLELRRRGVRVAVLSDIHFDVRPAFAAAGFGNAIDAFVLSFEQGMQKPDPRMFARTLSALGVGPADALMVGDRSGPDGAAVEAGITTLLLPPLTDVGDRRLHRVLALCETPSPVGPPRSHREPRGMEQVILMCGHAGSGKSTLARQLEGEGYVLLSFDEEAWRRGYRIHPVAAEAGREVTEHLQRRLTELVASGARVVVDTSFWARAARDEYRDVLASLGVKPVVYYLSTSRRVSLERLASRRNTGPNDIVVPVDRAIAYIEGFEVPTPDEGAVRVIRTESPGAADRAPTD